MKTKLLLTVLIGISSLSFSQSLSNSDRKKLQNYYLINEFNDSTLFYSGTMPAEEFVNSYRKTIKIKSFPTKGTRRGDYYNNAFMYVLIENSDQDLKKGKVGFYCHEFSFNEEYVYGYDDSGTLKGYRNVRTKVFYLEDFNGLHVINYKHQFKQFPKILGKQLYRKMMNSNKSKEQFLLDYFTEYNRNIDNLLQ